MRPYIRVTHLFYLYIQRGNRSDEWLLYGSQSAQRSKTQKVIVGETTIGVFSFKIDFPRRLPATNGQTSVWSKQLFPESKCGYSWSECSSAVSWRSESAGSTTLLHIKTTNWPAASPPVLWASTSVTQTFPIHDVCNHICDITYWLLSWHCLEAQCWYYFFPIWVCRGHDSVDNNSDHLQTFKLMSATN